MRQRSTLIILFGVAFLFVGGAIVYLLVNDDGGDGGPDLAEGETSISVYVAADTIPANTLGTDALAQGLLELDEVPSSQQPANAITNPDALQNAIFAVEVAEGSRINSGQLATRSLSNIQVPEGFDGVAVTIDFVDGGAGYVAPGDLVNIYGLYNGERNAGVTEAGVPLPRTELALTNVQVLDVSGQRRTSVQAATEAEEDAEANREVSNGAVTYFLAVTPRDAERLIQLQEYAGLYLSLPAEDAPNAGDTPGVDGNNVNAATSAASSGTEQP